MTGQDLTVEKLSISFGGKQVVHDLSFQITPGKILAMVGESGSGKSVTARSLVGLAGDRAQVTAASLRLGDDELLPLDDTGWGVIRGQKIGFVLQDALTSLDPLRTVGQEIEESLTADGKWRGLRNRASRRKQVLQLLKSTSVPEPEIRALQRADKLSGGLRQRALIASAIALNPGIVIADEPTTALDASAVSRVLGLFRDLKNAGHGILLISHDIETVSQVADSIIVVKNGEMIEQGETKQILRHPSQDYTRLLLSSVPKQNRKSPEPSTLQAKDESPLLVVNDIVKSYPNTTGASRLAVDHVSFTLRRGKTLGILGESGSGKTTTARIVAGFLEPDGGNVWFDGRLWSGVQAKTNRSVEEHERRPFRHEMGIVYQDPLSSFDPRWTVQRILADALKASAIPRAEHNDRIAALLTLVRLTPDISRRFPLQLSGGQRQRIAIARAIAGNPKMIVCDEPVSALDVSVQAQVLELLTELQERLNISYLFISHDLGVIRQVSDDVLVMQNGRVVEAGPTQHVFEAPQHNFTRLLLNSKLPNYV
ncbi:ABC transporter ATP-binding protein [Gluconobacter cerinus]|uniref:ATP-binding cassette domain-containing protein n=1 Tax=Gluconobacter TaxID=441 RepID=UPI001B8CEB95|nr:MULTISPECIES: ABC transporter ATP-binding protein [Gluconobacter]MBS0994096.1 ABC transporter ATP-binding protein [Gluconobacter cerinus]MBS1022517.1 ABC transporter ATP-binding protein [Gluconobacter cerinus]